MMRVIPAPEPKSFDRVVRQRGLTALRSKAERDYGDWNDAVSKG